MATSEELIEEVLENLSKDYADGNFVPILEADVVGYLYHLWILKIGSASKVHLDTRICGLEGKRFDFVVGDVNHLAERPCIMNPKLVLEVKSFPMGFTHQQHRVHYSHVLEDDIAKLAELKEPFNSRYIILFDEDNYLKGFDRKSKSSRMDRIVITRNEADQRIRIICINKEGKSPKWKIL